MKKIFVIIYLLFITYYSNGQVVFNNHYDSLGARTSRNVVVGNSCYYTVGGNEENNILGVVVSKIDNDGNFIWEKYYADTLPWFHGTEGSLSETGTGNYILGGNRGQNYSIDNLLIKFDANFDTIFTKKYYPVVDTSSNTTITYNTSIDTDSCYLLIGCSNIDNNYNELSQNNIQLIKTDTLGNLLWRKTYGNAVYYHWGFQISPAYNGGYIMGGYTNRNGGDWAIVKTDENGENPIYRYYGHMTYDDGVLMGITKTLDSCYLLYGAHSITDNTKRARIIKFDKNLNVEWDKDYHIEAYSTEFVKIIEKPDSSLICLAGHTTPYPETYIPTIFKLDKNGNVLFKESTGASSDTFLAGHNLLDIKIANDNGYICAGWATSVDWDVGQQMWLVKTDSMGCDGTEWTCGTTYLEDLVSKEDGGLLVYPNPVKNILNLDLHDLQDVKVSESQINTDYTDITDKQVLTKVEFNNLPIDKKLEYNIKYPDQKLWGKQEEQEMRELSRKFAYAFPFEAIKGKVDIFAIEPSLSAQVESKKLKVSTAKNAGEFPLGEGGLRGIDNSQQEITIYDINGRIVKNETLDVRQKTLEINVSSLQKGVYFVRVGESVAKFVKE